MGYTVTTKGQVTIPKPFRDRLRIEPGSAVSFRLNDRGEVVVENTDGQPPKSRFEAIRGVWAGRMTTDEIMALTRGEDD
ncbi:MAG: AbrB/MazE/SpoVT family DNA-binding domain-containing protein [Caulobacter sp.]|jgi:AbrB family looped-hinge helix DNA binding protein